MRLIQQTIIIVLFGLWLAPTLTTYAAGNTITVNSLAMTIANDGECTLPEAIIAANTDTDSGKAAGECIAGDGNDTIVIPRGATFILTAIWDSGTGLPAITDDVTIDGDGTVIQRDTAAQTPEFRLLRISSGRVIIDDVTLRNGHADLSSFVGNGGAIHALGRLTLTNVTLEDNMSEASGGGIYAEDNVIATNLTATGNHADGMGGAINVVDSDFTDNNGVYMNNSANQFGGAVNVSATTPASVSLDGTEFSSNHTNISGGGIRVEAYNNGVVTVQDATFDGNSANDGGGGAIFNTSTSVNVINSSFINNTADNSGGLGASSADVDVTQSNFNNNEALDGDGGGAYLSGGNGAIVTASQNNVTNNTASDTGGGLFMTVVGGTAEILSTNLTGNTANGIGGGGARVQTTDLTVTNALFQNNDAPNHNVAGGSRGGGLYFLGAITMTGTTFDGNSASYGGGVYADSGSGGAITDSDFDGNMAQISGGGMSINTNTTLTITDTPFLNNQADIDQTDSDNGFGGGLHIWSSQAEVTVQGTDPTRNIIANNSAYSGGGISARGQRFTMDSMRIENNHAFGNFGNGGGLYSNSNSIVTNSLFVNNHAEFRGGGMFQTPTPIPAEGFVTNTTFSFNHANSTGGGISTDSGQPIDVYFSTFMRNTAVNSGSQFSGNGDTMYANVFYGDDSSISNCAGNFNTTHNNISNDSFCDLDNNDYNNMDAEIVPVLADNGGLTMTHILRPDSVSINAVPYQYCVADLEGDNTPDPLTRDQRGEQRRLDYCDIGAVETPVGLYPFDLDVDGTVTPLDVIYVINRLGSTNNAADVDNNGIVNTADVTAVMNVLGTQP